MEEGKQVNSLERFKVKLRRELGEFVLSIFPSEDSFSSSLNGRSILSAMCISGGLADGLCEASSPTFPVSSVFANKQIAGFLSLLLFFQEKNKSVLCVAASSSEVQLRGAKHSLGHSLHSSPRRASFTPRLSFWGSWLCWFFVSFLFCFVFLKGTGHFPLSF